MSNPFDDLAASTPIGTPIGFGWDDFTSGWQTVHETVMPYAAQVPVVKEFVPLADLAYHAATGKPTQADIAAKKKAAAAKAVTTAKTPVVPASAPGAPTAATPAVKTSSAVLWVLGIGAAAAVGVVLLRRR